MATLATTSMSSKGQVVIPEAVRDALGLEPGAQFVVVGERDVVMLKIIARPSMTGFNTLITQARRAARRAGLKKSDVQAAVSKVRARR